MALSSFFDDLSGGEILLTLKAATEIGENEDLFTKYTREIAFKKEAPLEP